MIAASVMTALCTIGVAFYIRVLIALCKEGRNTWKHHLARLQLRSHEYPMLVQVKREKPLLQLQNRNFKVVGRRAKRQA